MRADTGTAVRPGERDAQDDPTSSRSRAELALLAELSTALAQSEAAYLAAAARVEAPLIRGLFIQRSDSRRELCRIFESRYAALGGRKAPVRPPVAAAIDRNAVDEPSVVDAIERHDAGLRRRLRSALAADVLGPETLDLVDSALAVISADYRKIRDLNLILH